MGGGLTGVGVGSKCGSGSPDKGTLQLWVLSTTVWLLFLCAGVLGTDRGELVCEEGGGEVLRLARGSGSRARRKKASSSSGANVWSLRGHLLVWLPS